MIRSRWIQKLVCSLTGAATLAGAMPVNAVEKTEAVAEAPVKVRDVELAEGGVLEMLVVDSRNAVMADVPVALEFQNKQVAAARTDKNGVVKFKGVHPGQHKIQTENGQQMVRLWEGDSAPPGAIRKLAVTSDNRIVRGQAGGSGLLLAGTGVLLVGGLVYSVVEINDLNDEIDALKTASP
jgi:hypothetical protein